jgi:uncharacterized protein (TIGR02421 family)
MWVSYKEKIRKLSDRIVEAQRPIRVLDSVKWNPKIEADFFADKGKSLPKVDADYYKKMSLGFDPRQKDAELAAISADIKMDLGETDDLGHLLLETVNQYRELIVMLEARGTKKFYDSSRKLYGSPKDRLFEDSATVMDQSRLIYDLLSSLEGKSFGQEYPKNLSSEHVVAELKKRFSKSFLRDRIDVRISDGIVADAAAGADVIKIKADTKFSKKDIDVFEVHEGWVHVATTLNGKAQKIATFLSKGPPRVAATQEGLAILMEIITFSTYPLRARTINDRILGVDKAEDGANFIEIYEFYRTEGYSDTDAFRNSMRVFRGACLEGGAPFTKDISYCRGFIENYNFIRTAIRRGLPEIVPFIFSGKVHVDDVPLLYQRSIDGVIDAPALLPPQFEDLNGLAVWMAFSNFLNTVDMQKVTNHYDSLFKKHL